MLPKLLTRTATYDAAWVTGPGPHQWSIHFALDDGMLRGVELSPQHFMAAAKSATLSFAAGAWAPCCSLRGRSCGGRGPRLRKCGLLWMRGP